VCLASTIRFFKVLKSSSTDGHVCQVGRGFAGTRFESTPGIWLVTSRFPGSQSRNGRSTTISGMRGGKRTEDAIRSFE
jgi:hypothetical protein